MNSKCPLCNNKASSKTIKSIGKCYNCNAISILERYFVDEKFLKSKTKNEYISDLTKQLILFLKQSKLKETQQNRIIIDFLKIINNIGNLNIKLSESMITETFYNTSAIKSSNALHTIKAFLFSKDLLDLDIKSDSFYPEEIRSVNRFKSDILDYFFSSLRCHDCGISKNKNQNYCNDCIAYRSIYLRTTIDYVDNTFRNSSVKGLYLNFVMFVYSLNRTVQTISDILSECTVFFDFIEQYIPNNLSNYPFQFVVQKGESICEIEVISNIRLFEFYLSEEWVKIFEEKFENKKRFMGIFLSFLEEVNVIKPISKNPKELLIKKINCIDKKFQKPILKLLEKEETTINLLKEKNAVISKKWITIENKLNQILLLYNWLVENGNINSWAEVTEDMINRYLLSFAFTTRQVRKRVFFNFFEYIMKNGFIFANPIEQFVARDKMIEEKTLSKEEHLIIHKSIYANTPELIIERFLSLLIYFHALTTKQIMEIQLKEISLEKKCIYINNRPPVYLSHIDIAMLQMTLIHREENLNRKSSIYLFPSYKSIDDKPMSKQLIRKKVLDVTGYTPKRLRTAALQFCAENFGAQYLHDCLGLSITQSARYAAIGENLLDEILKDELNKRD